MVLMHQTSREVVVRHVLFNVDYSLFNRLKWIVLYKKFHILITVTLYKLRALMLILNCSDEEATANILSLRCSTGMWTQFKYLRSEREPGLNYMELQNLGPRQKTPIPKRVSMQDELCRLRLCPSQVGSRIHFYASVFCMIGSIFKICWHSIYKLAIQQNAIPQMYCNKTWAHPSHSLHNFMSKIPYRLRKS